MSDFLSNLAARTIAAPSLRPRTRMRFEPGGANGVAEPALADASPAVPMPREQTSAAPEPSAKQEPPARTKIARPAVRVASSPNEPPPREERRPTAAAESSHRETGVTREAAAPPATERERLVVHEVPLVETHVETRVVREPAVETRIVRERAPAERIVEQQVERTHERILETREGPETERVVRETVTQKERPHRHDERPPRMLREETVRDRETRVERVQPREIVRGRDVVRRDSMQQPQRAERRREADGRGTPAAQSEPVVHVSIGRVEVRAVAPAAAPPRAQRRSPVMTIDDYVAKRKERP
jgi:hypothetical protein